MVKITDGLEVLEKVIAYSKANGILDEDEENSIDNLLEILKQDRNRLTADTVEHSCDNCVLANDCTLIGSMLNCPAWSGN